MLAAGPHTPPMPRSSHSLPPLSASACFGTSGTTCASLSALSPPSSLPTPLAVRVTLASGIRCEAPSLSCSVLCACCRLFLAHDLHGVLLRHPQKFQFVGCHTWKTGPTRHKCLACRLPVCLIMLGVDSTPCARACACNHDPSGLVVPCLPRMHALP
jgi:hypothetical protein